HLGDRALHVGSDVAGVHRDGVGLGRRQARLVGAVDEQAPDLLERHAADQVLDVDTAVAQRRPFLVGFGDLALERDDAFQAVVHFSHAAHLALRRVWRHHGGPVRAVATTTVGPWTVPTISPRSGPSTPRSVSR